MPRKDLYFSRNPRFKTDFPARVESEFVCFQSIITNISTCGLQFECDYQSLHDLMPNIARPNPHLPIEFGIQFQVPTTTSLRANINLVCSLVYARRLNHKTACVGCQFGIFKGDSEGALMDYINNFGQAF